MSEPPEIWVTIHGEFFGGGIDNLGVCRGVGLACRRRASMKWAICW